MEDTCVVALQDMSPVFFEVAPKVMKGTDKSLIGGCRGKVVCTTCVFETDRDKRP